MTPLRFSDQSYKVRGNYSLGIRLGVEQRLPRSCSYTPPGIGRPGMVQSNCYNLPIGETGSLSEGFWKVAVFVIASEAKQSEAEKEIASSPMAPRNDTSASFSKHFLVLVVHSLETGLWRGLSVLT